MVERPRRNRARDRHTVNVCIQTDAQRIQPMVRRQCGNDRPGFGLPSITSGIAGYNYKTFLGLNIKIV
jgi:hypothetical protein